jgi:glycosyltransferase involved in cell wall biosynthesis
MIETVSKAQAIQLEENFKLVLCLERFWPAHGGVERYSLEIARWFQNICPVFVVTAVRQNRTLREELSERRDSFVESVSELPGVQVFTAGLGRVGQAWFRTIASLEDHLNTAFREHYYRTRWLVMQETARLLARSVARILEMDHKCPVVLHAMGPWELSHVGDRLFPHAARVATPFIHPGHWGEDEFSRKWFRSRDCLVALGREDARICGEVGIPSKQVSTVPLFGPETLDAPLDNRNRNAVVFLGVARSYKGVGIFLEAAKRLGKERGDLEFIWAGSVPAESYGYIGQAQAVGVKVLGPVSESEKMEILGRALCLCLPSATEITPYTILEAWGAGASVITTDDPYLREFVGEGGDLVPREAEAVAAAVRRLAERPALAAYRAHIGRSYLQARHHASIVGPLLLDAYQGAIARRRRLVLGKATEWQ